MGGAEAGHEEFTSPSMRVASPKQLIHAMLGDDLDFLPTVDPRSSEIMPQIAT